MKELSIEEKAKAYDNLIERLKDFQFEYRFSPFTIEKYFPELKESEDERIRKHLIKHFGNKSKEDWNGVPVKSILAWLEKQCEKGTNGNEREFPIPEPPLTLKRAKEVMGIKQDDAWSEEDDRMYNIIISYIPQHLTEESYTACINWLKSIKDRYTWKPSDEQMDALRYVTNFDYGGHKATLVSLYEQLKKLKG